MFTLRGVAQWTPLFPSTFSRCRSLWMSISAQTTPALRCALSTHTPLAPDVLNPGVKSILKKALVRNEQFLEYCMKELYVSPTLYGRAARFFRSDAMENWSDERKQELLAASKVYGSDPEKISRWLQPYFAEFVRRRFPDEIEQFRTLSTCTDLRLPHEWFPSAREMKRHIIYHAGPTNSGKTYNALKCLSEADSGVYCGPLRLLALEVYEKLNRSGVYASLLTGQEKRTVPFSNHSSCTVEMASVTQSVKVAVLDEIQLIGDDMRGWAWTRALLGMPANEIHVCGDASAINLVSDISEVLGDTFEVRRYERLSELSVDSGSLRGSLSNVKRGDCVIAFSRKEILSLRKEIESATGLKCCVVYGQLPPETRTKQAQVFNDPSSGYDVLVASDAVGMGLNLNIRRIVFTTMEKFDGVDLGPIPFSLVKQIAGRAGRHGSVYDSGAVTTLYPEDLGYLRKCLAAELKPLVCAGLFPTYEQIEHFAKLLSNEKMVKLSALLDRFVDMAVLDGRYFVCKYDHLKLVAKRLHRVDGLSLEERFTMMLAPINVRDSLVLTEMTRMATSYAAARVVPLGHMRETYKSWSPDRAVEQLRVLERNHHLCDLYLWLSMHFPDAFSDDQLALDRRTGLITGISDGLESQSVRHRQKKSARKRRDRRRARSGNGDSADDDPFVTLSSLEIAEQVRAAAGDHNVSRKWEIDTSEVEMKGMKGRIDDLFEDESDFADDIVVDSIEPKGSGDGN